MSTASGASVTSCGVSRIPKAARSLTNCSCSPLAVNTTTAAGNALVLGVGAVYVIRGEMTVGDLLVVIAYVASMYQPLEAISTTASEKRVWRTVSWTRAPTALSPWVRNRRYS